MRDACAEQGPPPCRLPGNGLSGRGCKIWQHRTRCSQSHTPHTLTDETVECAYAGVAGQVGTQPAGKGLAFLGKYTMTKSPILDTRVKGTSRQPDAGLRQTGFPTAGFAAALPGVEVRNRSNMAGSRFNSQTVVA